jgi:type I site-specific restriction endonuclease
LNNNLNLPEYQFNIRKSGNKLQIFDNQRKKFVALTPEEWVRQHFLRFLIEEKHFPAALLAVEKELIINGLNKRCDAVLFNREGEPLLIIELKAPQIPLTQAVFDQVAVYNSKLNVAYFIVSNGLQHYCCQVDKENVRYKFLPEIPPYEFFQA